VTGVGGAESAYRRLESAVGARDAPLAIVDLGALHANASAMVAQAGGLPIRVASKSVRCVDVLRRVLAMPGYAGVLAFTPAEAVHLADQGVTDDLLVAYPSVDKSALATVARRVADGRPGRIVLMVDSVEGAAFVSAAAAGAGVRLPVAIDVDTAWRPARGVTAGALRSPVRTPDDASALARALVADECLELVAMMAYDAQVAGVGDHVRGKPMRSAAVRGMQSASLRELAERLPRVVAAVRAEVERGRGTLELVNGGGTGSLSRIGVTGAVTELAAGSGLFAPALFDGYRSLHLQPAALFALPVVRRPGPGVVTVLGGGYVASGPAGKDRLPTPVLPTGLRLTGTEGAGEVQTPVRGAAADRLALGDRVWFRHTKAGELCERFHTLLLVEGDADATVVAEVPTYRGEGHAFA
jgi:D-serine deaminase-like pyridoxal phosphate-dependent protein